jgi:hypothetical protein
VAGDRPSGFINSVKDVGGNFQTGFCTGFFDQFPDQTDAAEDYASTGSRNVWKHAVLDRIMFRAVWRIVGHPDFQSEPVCQILQIGFDSARRSLGLEEVM